VAYQPHNLCLSAGTLPAKPILKWAGGKTQLLKVLVASLPKSFNRYIEPFLGGGALLFRLALAGALASDSNQELIQFYGIVRDRADELLAAVTKLPVAREVYYTLRSADPESMDPISRAARFLYLNKTCYNGLHRVNRKGQFNTPFGGRTHVRVVDPDNIRRAAKVLAQTELLCADYRDILHNAEPGDFVYLDPPYLPLGGYSDFKRYTPQFFGHEDHIQLAADFRDLAARRVQALLSNSANPAIEELYSDFPMIRVRASRQINCRANGRGQITELLIANYDLGWTRGFPDH
jgi:DNA adenine methylase